MQYTVGTEGSFSLMNLVAVVPMATITSGFFARKAFKMEAFPASLSVSVTSATCSADLLHELNP